jgi:transcriptional regulator with XRE-family HTH domain
MTSPNGGHDRVSTKAKLANELRILGNLLARARERVGLKQFDVAARLSLPPSYLSKIENGTRRLDVIEFVQIANAMNVDPGEIMRELETALREQSATLPSRAAEAR